MQFEQQKQLVEAWLNQELEPSLPLHYLGEESSDGFVSRGNYVGTDDSDLSATGASIYSDVKNIGSAMGSILCRVMKKAKFNPADSIDNPNLTKSFDAFVKALGSCPFLTFSDLDRRAKSNKDSNYDGLINQVVGLYDGVSNADKSKLKDSIGDLAKSLINKKSAEETKEMLSVSTVDITTPTKPKLWVYHMRIEMKKMDGKSVVEIQKFFVTKITYRVNQKLIQSMANTLQKLDQKNIDEWVTDITSPETTGQSKEQKLCFEIQPFYD